MFNFRAWCANLGSNLLLGQEQKQRREEQPSNDTSHGESAESESTTPEQPTELRILPATTAEEESWEIWKEVRPNPITTRALIATLITYISTGVVVI